MLASLGTLPELARQLSGLGGCTHPVRLDGHRTEYAVDTTTGEVGRVLHHLDSTALPAGNLLVRCNNRRATRCAACAEVYRRDTFHLITAGLRGGKGTPEQVGTHPRVFATFTAPSFGPVHNRPSSGRPCRCGVRHDDTDPALGTPLDPETYDYEAAVLWNAHAGALWRRFSIYLRREVAKRAGLTQRAFHDHARISFAKVTEYQKRGAVHFHAVIRLDGPEGGDTSPPAWATAELLSDAIHAAANATRVHGPTVDGRAYSFAFGRQLDVRPIRSADFDGGQELTDRAVAAYIAKYATKGAETATGTLDRPIRFLAELAQARITDHARRMIRTAWTLGARPELADLRLRAWAHMLGFRGHFSTKSRRYSTTLGALRDARADWRRAQAAPPASPRAPFTSTWPLGPWSRFGSAVSGCGGLRRAAEGCLMANKKGRRRRFGAVRQYRSGKWTASYLAPDGERVRAPETFETKKDAEIWLSQVEADLSRGDWRSPDAGAVNFREYAEKWVEERELAVRTVDLYHHLLRLHILPTFGALDLDEITAPRVREWRAERLRATSAKTTVAKAYRLLKGIMETAVDDDLISRNPFRIKGAGKESAAERRIATVAQVDALADAIGIRWRLMVYLGAYGPMRPEELAGLRRRDVDLDNLVIRVRVAEPERTNGKRAPGVTKSDAGARLVVLPAFLEKDVRRHLAWYAEKGPDGLVFVGEKGAAFRRTSFGRKWRHARMAAGLPDGFRFYDLRHTGHTLSTRSGATLKDTMVRAGQSSEKAALIYQHSDDERQRELAAGLDEMVRAERAKNHTGDSAHHKEEATGT